MALLDDPADLTALRATGADPDELLASFAEWAEAYRRFWDASYERLDEYLQHLKAKESPHERPE